MAGIVGIASPNKQETVRSMLDKIAYRGKSGKEVFSNDHYTLGIIWNACEWDSVLQNIVKVKLADSGNNYRLAEANIDGKEIFLTRDKLGIAPLYLGYNYFGELCFASEVKALINTVAKITELLPGSVFNGKKQEKVYNLNHREHFNIDPEIIAKDLYKLLDKSIYRSVNFDSIGAWLSGGLDSSTISSIARKYVSKLHTFAAGMKGAPDFEYAREVAKHIDSIHHEIVVSLKEMIHALPEVIYHLENFDALLVRSSIINYLATKEASNYINEVFSGEAGDELFAGYAYLKNLHENQLENELIDITGRLHNTALQRVDRCSSAFGIIPHVPFADPEVFEYALSIPVKYKLYNGIEKWILRKAIEKELPEKVLNRPKAKFWEGGGIGEILAEYASKHISNHDFKEEKELPNGWALDSKEELMYYRIFKEHFGEQVNLDWMGRTKK